ncbi:MAG: hypothetical protein JW786_04565 [Desulfobacterales bacterium]|nr:hypothetical protein [Desulfobacterales bacterium]
MKSNLRDPLYKRIKRHVIGQIKDFFIVTAPGLEKLCLDELRSLSFSNQEAAVVRGGIEFKGRLYDCYLANLNLRTANRVLMRIGEFKATNLRQLAKNLENFSWELYLTPRSSIHIHVTTSHSRLYHKDLIRCSFEENIKRRLDPKDCIEKSKNDKQQIFVRVSNDRFIVSIDSSGDNLYKRGLKQYGGKAPIRETIAAALLKLSEYNCKEPLIDPMCGSGTFSLEAALMSKNMPPGWFREFAFMRWPSFIPKRWEYIKREARTRFINFQKQIIFASDKNKEMCLNVEKKAKAYELSDIVKTYSVDFFELSPMDLVQYPGLVIINPPYGLRIGTKSESNKIFCAISDKLKKEYIGWKLALIASNSKLAKENFPNLNFIPFYHGGLKLTLIKGIIT